MSNVIPFRHRHSAEGDLKRGDILATLRSTTRVPLEDRAAFALRLGEASAKLSERPLDGARKIFEVAWGDGNGAWAKRKRYLRFPDENGSAPGKEGSYASSGASWAQLISTAASLLGGGNEAPENDRARERHIRRLVQGTFLLPTQGSMPTGAEGAREIIDEYATRLAKRISTETRLPELFDILRTAPFSVHPADTHGDELEGFEAAIAAAFGGTDQKWIFSGKPDQFGKLDLRWSHPSMLIGSLARTEQRKLFVVPEELTESFYALGGDDDEDRLEAEKAVRWLHEVGGKRVTQSWFDFPETEYNAAKGFGWKSMAFEHTRRVFIGIRPRGDGLGVWVSVEPDEFEDFVPQDFNHDLVRWSLMKKEQWKDFTPISSGSQTSWTFESLYWPADIAEVYGDKRFLVHGRPKGGSIIGLLEAVWPDWTGETGIEGWLDDHDHAELAGLIFGGSVDIRFVPIIEFDQKLPVPCKSASVAGTLLRNLLTDEDCRIPSKLAQAATEIANAGCAFHNLVLEQHRALLDRI